ncbi:VirD4-like conjugal transfer protein, CD1115 family [Muricomes intestini]|jgi:type IV secretion system protein VirD4|uniref:VirD4-like conjugal transfer protein, CD1115 family n=1 Tax=Muricomes intestini TaxID=1796634 RepID=UPI002FDF6FC9
MIQRKRTPWGVLLSVLVFLCVLAYFLCGLFLLSGVNLTNFQDKLLYILLHPFQNWWNDKTVGFIGVAFLIWVMFVAWYLDNNRNYQSGKEKGTEEWGNVKKLSKTLRDKDEMKNMYLSQNIAISNSLLSNQNMLVIGGSGSYKTTSVLTPNILMASCTNVILDIKGDLLRKHGKYLIKHGVTVKSLNFINPEESDRYNPFAYVARETDLIKLITNTQLSVKPPDAMKGDPFWDDGVALYLQAMFYYEWLQAKDEGRKACFNNILVLVNMESKHVDEEGTTALQQEMNRLAAIKGDDYPPVRDYRKLKEGASETVRSIVIMVNAMLRLCETASIKRILSDDDLDIKSLGLGINGNPDKKTALFLVMPDNDESFNFFISMFYTQLFDVLLYTADHECHGELPIHVRLWADEFYAGPKPNNTEKLMGTIRSRNMSIVPILQSVSQIKAIFPQDKWEIFMENCAAAIYLGSGPMAHSTHKYISDLLGDMTIDTRNDNRQLGMQGQTSLNNGRDGRTLMTPAEVKRMSRKDCILFIEGQYPIYDQKALPFRTQRWIESAALALPFGYKHPVRVIYNENTMTYRTLKTKKTIQFLDKREVQFFKEAEKTDSTIRVFEMDEEDFLYLNWRKKPPLSEEEVTEIFQQAKAEKNNDEQQEEELPEDVKLLGDQKNVPDSGTEVQTQWDLSGSVFQCIKRYAVQLSEAQLNEILVGLESGLSEKQIKSYFCLPAEKMNQYRRAYMFSSSK